MMKQGTMQPVKKVLGVALVIMAAGSAFNIELVSNFMGDYPFVGIGVMAVSGYFMLISGRQR